MTPKISAVLVVLNENADGLLEQCLKQLRTPGFIDEIVLVDGGSTDGTQDVAAPYVDKLLHYEWGDNHALSRNFGIEHAEGDWILTVDPDELWEDGFVEGSHQLIQNHPDVDGWVFYTKNFVEIPEFIHTKWTPDPHIRLFSKVGRYKEDIAIHEQLDGLHNVKNNPGLGHLYHYGWCRPMTYLYFKIDRRAYHEGRYIGYYEPFAESKIYGGTHPKAFDKDAFKLKDGWEWEKYYEFETFRPLKKGSK